MWPLSAVAVGNFDGNAAGREDVRFIYGFKRQSISSGSDDDYGFVSSYRKGSYRDTDNAYGPLNRIYGADLWREASVMSGKSLKGDNLEENINYLFVAMDKDQDGVMARYKGKGFAYSDPTVLAVLQAAPYFGEQGGYSDFDNNVDALEESYGYRYDTLSQYGFTWSFGKWNWVYDTARNKTPMLGYVVKNIKAPPAAVTDLELSAYVAGTETFTFRWSDPNTSDEGATRTPNAGFNTGGSYSDVFVVTAVAADSSESIWSNQAGNNTGGAGKSAYELAVLNGFVGTEEWLASLEGEPGLSGRDGKDGVGIADVCIDSDGYLIVTLTDNTLINAGSARLRRRHRRNTVRLQRRG